MTATIHELFPIDALKCPDGRIAQINREIADLETMGATVLEAIRQKELELEALKLNASQVYFTYKNALDDRDAVLRGVVHA